MSSAAAQQVRPEAPPGDRWHPQWGDWSLALHLPADGPGGFGFWRQRSPTLGLGVVVDGHFLMGRSPDLGTGERRELVMEVGPAVKRYWWRDGPVSPFLHGRVAGAYAVAGATEQPTRWRYGGGASVGVGAEWFPARGVGIGGHTGIGARYMVHKDDATAATSQALLTVELFTSSLALHLYF